MQVKGVNFEYDLLVHLVVSTIIGYDMVYRTTFDKIRMQSVGEKVCFLQHRGLAAGCCPILESTKLTRRATG